MLAKIFYQVLLKFKVNASSFYALTLLEVKMENWVTKEDDCHVKSYEYVIAVAKLYEVQLLF